MMKYRTGTRFDGVAVLCAGSRRPDQQLWADTFTAISQEASTQEFASLPSGQAAS